MPRPLLHARVIWLVAGIVQFALPGAASLADARLHAEEARARPHVDSQGATGCPRVHPADCGLCRTIGTTAQVGHGTLFIAGRAGPASAPSATAGALLEFQRRLPQSRAPPTLS
jgi:hypothetical protein